MKLRTSLIAALLSLLMVLLASSLVQAFSGVFYVTAPSYTLRECAGPECGKLLTVYKGDKVEILERQDAGWSKVRLVDQEGIGWIPSNMLSYSPDLTGKKVPHYYVNTTSLTLQEHPRPDSKVLKTLHFNDPVEMLGTSSGYAQVRDLESSIVGWALPRYLSPQPLNSPKPRRR
jgi:uncharacterized protein YgiM (DUF1202 family)